MLGIRGMINPLHVHSLLEFVEIHHKHWKIAVERFFFWHLSERSISSTEYALEGFLRL